MNRLLWTFDDPSTQSLGTVEVLAIQRVSRGSRHATITRLSSFYIAISVGTMFYALQRKIGSVAAEVTTIALAFLLSPFAFVLLAIYWYDIARFSTLAISVTGVVATVNAVVKGRRAVFSVGYSAWFLLSTFSQQIKDEVSSLNRYLFKGSSADSVLNLMLCCAVGFLCVMIVRFKEESQTQEFADSLDSDI